MYLMKIIFTLIIKKLSKLHLRELRNYNLVIKMIEGKKNINTKNSQD